MSRTLALCLLLMLFARPGLAQERQEQPFSLIDPLAIHIACAGTLETGMLGPYEAQVSIFAVPEPGGVGERLYVGLAEDIVDRRSAAHLWKGPVAAGWAMLGPVPGYKPDVTAPNPARYRVQRKTAIPGGRMQVELMEIDLTTRLAQLRKVDSAPGQAKHGEEQSLDELPMNDSLRLITRLDRQKTFRLGGLTVRSYEMVQGDIAPPAKRPVILKPWDIVLESHLLAVSSSMESTVREAVYFLPMRPSGWKVRQQLPPTASGKRKDRIALEMFADYLVPDDQGGLLQRSARHVVSVGVDGLSLTTEETGYLYDVSTERWSREPLGKRF